MRQTDFSPLFFIMSGKYTFQHGQPWDKVRWLIISVWNCHCEIPWIRILPGSISWGWGEKKNLLKVVHLHNSINVFKIMKQAMVSTTFSRLFRRVASLAVSWVERGAQIIQIENVYEVYYEYQLIWNDKGWSRLYMHNIEKRFTFYVSFAILRIYIFSFSNFMMKSSILRLSVYE